MGQLTDLLYQVNTAALVEALLEMGINQDIMTTIVAGRYDELRVVVFKQLSSSISSAGVQRELPKDIQSLVQFYSKLALDGGICESMEVENVTDSSYTLVANNCMFKATRDILAARHPDSTPPCFLAALLAGIAGGVSGKRCTPESVEIMGDKCRFITSIE